MVPSSSAQDSSGSGSRHLSVFVATLVWCLGVSLMPWMTVAENLLLRDPPRGRAGLIRRRALAERADEIFAGFGVGGIDPLDLVSSLSVAQRQMIEIVRALRRQPAVLFVNGSRHELTKAALVLGRSRDCDIRLDDPNVSRRHAEVRREDGSYWVVDLGSTNGIELNGRKVDRARLTNDDRITIGRTEVRVEIPG